MNLARPPRRYWRIAHRGATALAPPNSLAALEAALACAVDMVELDVLLDGGELRLAHSRQELRADSPGLDEALALFAKMAGPQVLLDLDVKDPGSETVLLEMMRAHSLVERTFVTSFHPGVLRSMRKLEPTVTTGLSYPNDRFGLSGQRALASFVDPGLRVLGRVLPLRIARMLAATEADAAMLHHALVSPEVVSRCHGVGAAVLAWTVEAPADLARVLEAGADGAVANDLGLFDD